MSLFSGALADTPIIVLDDEDRIACDVPCIGCGRNLRGSVQAKRCEHCNTPARRSGRGNQLACANPAWIRRLADGPWYIIGSIVVSYVLALAAGRYGFAQAQSGTPVEPSPWGPLLGKLIGGTVCVIGLWFATTPEPVRLHCERPLSLRRCARWGFVLAHVVSLVGCAVAFSHTRSAEGLQLLSLTIDTFAMVCMGFWAAALARRLPDAILASMCRLFAGALLVASIPYIVFNITKFDIGKTTNNEVTRLIAQIRGFAAFGVLACYILGIMLAFQFRKRLRTITRQAYRTWNAA